MREWLALGSIFQMALITGDLMKITPRPLNLHERGKGVGEIAFSMKAMLLKCLCVFQHII